MVLVVEDLEVATGEILVLIFSMVVEVVEMAARVLLELDEIEEDFVDEPTAGVMLVLEP